MGTNSIMARMTKGAPEPEVGMGATIIMWSDRHAATIIEVARFKTGARAGQVKAVTVQEDHAQRVDKNGMGDNQHYVYLPNPQGNTWTFKVRPNGSFGDKMWSLAIGFRDEHYDFSL